MLYLFRLIIQYLDGTLDIRDLNWKYVKNVYLTISLQLLLRRNTLSLPLVTNCPNCGAPIDSDKCPYCGTRLVNIADLEAGEPIWLIFKDRNFDNIVRGVRVLITGINISVVDSDPVVFYADDRKYCHYINPTQDVTVELSGTLTPNEKGFFGIRLDKNVADDPNIRHYI